MATILAIQSGLGGFSTCFFIKVLHIKSVVYPPNEYRGPRGSLSRTGGLSRVSPPGRQFSNGTLGGLKLL
ncbi:hypothetical protein BPOR_0228g00070 [Botrytis porri]|uniref:Uncharacterized protein n=1 Tax=Botrytis porri TaxID=87229 RepID=A0A4Z1KTE9_9HELO|nr:hypothetical protein BPOR_0228g00070 [Botrytis porri]